MIVKGVSKRRRLVYILSLKKRKKKENFELYSQKKNTELVCLTWMKMETE